MTEYTTRPFTLRERLADWLTGGRLTAIDRSRQREELRANTEAQMRVSIQAHLSYYMMLARADQVWTYGADLAGNAKDVTTQDRSITAPTSGC